MMKEFLADSMHHRLANPLKDQNLAKKAKKTPKMRNPYSIVVLASPEILESVANVTAVM